MRKSTDRFCLLLVKGAFAYLLLHVDGIFGEGSEFLEAVAHEFDLVVGARFWWDGQNELHLFADFGLGRNREN